MDPKTAMEEDGDDKDDSKRRTRNLSEKKRRDQFNLLVNELSTMVSSNNRKMDKSTVLKATIAFLKQHNETTVRSRVHDVQEHWKPSFLSNEEFTYLILEALEGFVMVFSIMGRIHYVSDSVTSLLGHNPTDMMNMSIFDLTYEDDLPNLYNVLQNPANMLESIQGSEKENEISFQCHLRRGTLDFRDETTYELIQFHGNFRTNTDQSEDGLNYQEDSRLFVCTGHLYTPQLIRDVSLVDPNQCEFTSRHSLEWKFLFLDHRASPIIGYLPFEVLGTSGYDYYHFDDLEKVVTCHEALMQKGELTSCYYRFLTKGQQWIWLQTRFYITYHQWNSKPQFVVCTHRVVSIADIAKNMKQEEAPEPMIEDIPETTVKPAPADTAAATVSPTYMAELNDDFTANYQTLTQPASVKPALPGSTAGTAATASAPGTPWPRSHASFHVGASDTASVSAEPRESQRNDREANLKIPSHALVPQHVIGAQYLEPGPYVNIVSVPMQQIPMVAPSEQTQIQLQRKHEELQQLIVRQQEELCIVKEQLLLTRLGMLQPIPVLVDDQGLGQYIESEEIQPNSSGIPQIMYDEEPQVPEGTAGTEGLAGPGGLQTSDTPGGIGAVANLGQSNLANRNIGPRANIGNPGNIGGPPHLGGNGYPPHNATHHSHMPQ